MCDRLVTYKYMAEFKGYLLKTLWEGYQESRMWWNVSRPLVGAVMAFENNCLG